MKKLLLIGAAALLVPGIAAAADLTGSWKLDLNIADMKVPVGCTLIQTGAALTGTCNRTDQEEKPNAVTGAVDGAVAKFAYNVDFGDMPLHVAYTGNITSDTAMSGTLEVAGTMGTFTGAKQ
jgi:hypothetical protein